MTFENAIQQIDGYFEAHLVKTVDRMRSDSVDEEIIDILESEMRAEYRTKMRSLKAEIESAFDGGAPQTCRRITLCRRGS